MQMSDRLLGVKWIFFFQMFANLKKIDIFKISYVFL